MSQETEQLFYEFLCSVGLKPHGSTTIIGDGKRRRFRVDGDTAGKQNGWYILFADDRPNGVAGSWRFPGKHTWSHRTSNSTVTEEDRKRWALKREESEKEERRRQERAAQIANRTWSSLPKASPENPYAKRKRITPLGARQHGDVLVVPVRDQSGALLSLQSIAADGDKKFLPGGRIDGCYATVASGVPAADSAILIAEGFATACTLHEATTLPVIVAFNAANIVPVAKALRTKYPDRVLLICADNDRFTTRPSAHDPNVREPYNPGHVFAERAAEASECAWVSPAFKSDEDRGTDFNDLATSEGLEMVAAHVHEALRPTKEPDPETPAFDDVPVQELEPPPPDYDGPPMEGDPEDYDPSERHSDEELPKANRLPFKALGFSKGNTFHFLIAGTGQVLDLTAQQLGNHATLLSLASLQWWRNNFVKKSGGGGDGIDWSAATSALIQAAMGAGFYSPDRVRGRGAWWDDGRTMFHLGDQVMVDHVPVALSHVRSRYIYESGAPIAVDLAHPLSTAEANEFAKFLDMLSWDRPIYSRFLAGWCVVAHIGGALKWRPHAWVVGRKGSGKSYVMGNIVRRVMGDNCSFVASNTTEAGIRQSLGLDSLPVLFDEAEGENARENDRLQKVLALVRQSSSETGAKIIKGTSGGKAHSFQIRSCFVFSSINSSLIQQSDRSRVSILELNQDQQKFLFTEIQEAEANLFKPGFAERFVARALKLAPVIRENADTFAQVVAGELGEQRAGDQIGTLLAGAYALYSDKVISLDAARKWVNAQDWSEHQEEVRGQSDEQALLEHLLLSKVRVEKGGGFDVPVGFLVDVMLGQTEPGESGHVNDKDAEATLRHNGFIVKRYEGLLIVANDHPAIRALLRDTPWGSNWSATLRRLPGATLAGTHSFGSRGAQKRGVSVPLADPVQRRLTDV